MSSDTIAVFTLWIGIVAATAAIIAAVPQIPVLIRMIFKPKPSVEILLRDATHVELTLRNGKLHDLVNVTLILEFEGAESVKVKSRRNAMGMILGTSFEELAHNVFQYRLSSPVAPNSTIHLEDLDVVWENGTEKKVAWKIFIKSKMVREGTAAL